MPTKQITITIITLFVGGVGTIAYQWASWTTATLIAVDKRTEVMAVKIENIADKMDVENVGYKVTLND